MARKLRRVYTVADITVGNMLSFAGIIAAVAGSYGIVQYRVGALAKDLDDEISDIKKEIKSAVDKKELESFKREFDSFKNDIKIELGEIKSLLRNPQTGTSVFMLRTECDQHEKEICRLISDIKTQLHAMDNNREQARKEDAETRRESENKLSALWADVAILRAETKLKRDDGK